MRVLNEHTTPERWQTYLQQLREGENAALLSDAGTPGISDPGAGFVDQCYQEGILVDAIPGPSAVTTALMLSGFYAQRFCFLGFLGRKPGAIRSELSLFKDSTMTLVLFESPYRIHQLLGLAYERLGARRYALCREMTKLHQQVFRETLPATPSPQEVPLKGEFTLVIEGKRRSLS
jgi:16S rRNA (cytidine1402-2'-O)-methyltransferase